jgi:K+-sensing histidine kinase KdpD
MNLPSESNPLDPKFKRTMLWLKFAMVIFPIALMGQIWILWQSYSLTNLFFVFITAIIFYSTFQQYRKFKNYESAVNKED